MLKKLAKSKELKRPSKSSNHGEKLLSSPKRKKKRVSLDQSSSPKPSTSQSMTASKKPKKVVFISDSPSSESDEVTIITPTSQKLSQASLRKKVNKDFLEKRATAKLPKSRVIKKKLNL